MAAEPWMDTVATIFGRLYKPPHSNMKVALMAAIYLTFNYGLRYLWVDLLVGLEILSLSLSLTSLLLFWAIHNSAKDTTVPDSKLVAWSHPEVDMMSRYPPIFSLFMSPKALIKRVLITSSFSTYTAGWTMFVKNLLDGRDLVRDSQSFIVSVVLLVVATILYIFLLLVAMLNPIKQLKAVSTKITGEELMA